MDAKSYEGIKVMQKWSDIMCTSSGQEVDICSTWIEEVASSSTADTETARFNNLKRSKSTHLNYISMELDRVVGLEAVELPLFRISLHRSSHEARWSSSFAMIGGTACMNTWVKFQRWISCDIRATVPVKKSAKIKLHLQRTLQICWIDLFYFVNKILRRGGLGTL